MEPPFWRRKCLVSGPTSPCLVELSMLTKLGRPWTFAGIFLMKQLSYSELEVQLRQTSSPTPDERVSQYTQQIQVLQSLEINTKES